MVRGYPAGNSAIGKIASSIHLGAMVFMHREYRMLGMFSSVLVVLLGLFLGWHTALAFFCRSGGIGIGWIYRHVHRHRSQCPYLGGRS
jgi:K(+)-stimulated pyrophosphate-energized sodium pump